VLVPHLNRKSHKRFIDSSGFDSPKRRLFREKDSHAVIHQRQGEEGRYWLYPGDVWLRCDS
jgi:hypothetical protein